MNDLYAVFNKISLQTTQMIYDVRFDEATSLICKSFISEICLSCSSAMSLIVLFRAIPKQYSQNMIVVCNNDAIYMEHLMTSTEQFVDNLCALAEDTSVFDLIDKYVAFINEAKRVVDKLTEPYLTEDTQAAITLLRTSREQVDDSTDDDTATLL